MLTQFVRNLLIPLLCVLIFCANLYLDFGNNDFTLLVLTGVMLFAFYPYGSTSLGAIVLFSAVTLFVVPLYALMYVNLGVSPAWLALYILLAMLLLAWLPADRFLATSSEPRRYEFVLIVVLLSVGLASQAFGGIEQIFHATYAMSVVHLERLHASTPSRPRRLIALAVILAAIMAYSLLFWSGYGRLILASFALAPILVSVHYRTFKLNVFAFSIGAGALVFIGRVMRFGWSDGVAGLADDSGASPLTLTQGLWQGAGTVNYHEPIWHQWSLLVIQWFPRSLWPDKPVGINYTFVDVFMGRAGLGEEHSTAIGFFGEHIFLAGGWWLVSAFVLVLVVTGLSRAVKWASAPYGSPGIMFNAWLVTLFWGGMADFGSRVWFSVAPMVVYILILNRVGKWTEAPRLAAGPLHGPALGAR
ncbi:hypothetical protein [Sphingomonas sp.]|uniref:hypothetical protein n=1 Tax=Sphingomonas sp. TaxID=28214 RepID=UPI0035BC7023